MAINFDNASPWKDIVPCNVAANGTVTNVGSPTRDGSAGRTMVRIPKYWIKAEEKKVIAGIEWKQTLDTWARLTDANISGDGIHSYNWVISPVSKPGFEVHPAFNQRAVSPPADYIYVAAYEATLMDDAGVLKLDSKTGEQPWTGYSSDVKDGMLSIPYNSGSVEFTVGETLTGATSAHTGVVVAYHLTSGTWGGGDAAGTVYAKQASGAFQAEDLNGSTGGANMASATGAGTGVPLTVGNARTYATNIGTGWGLMNIWTLSAIQMLYMVEYGSMDSQTNVGRGIVDKASGTGFAGEVTGFDSIDTNLAANGTGTGTGVDGVTPVAYRWMENLWGNTWGFIDGYNAVDAEYRMINRDGSGTFADTLAAGDYEASVATPIATDGYISDIIFEELLKYQLFASAVAGGATTYIPDYWYAHDAGETNIALAGGSWGSGANTGLAYLSSRYDVAFSTLSVAGRAEFIA
ncbi:hypothetical protein H8E77_05250 [bacterium]|nr:hypothetical protein [bacterium]